jgi:TRAP-type C4-dicarboxylate transport system permease small subunit
VNKLENTIFWRGLAKALRIGLMVTSILVTLIVFGSVILRELNLNFLGYEEILIIVAFWLYMLGTAYGSYEQSHITADIIVVMMKEGRLKSILAIIRNTLTLVLGIIFLLWALELVEWTVIMDTRTPVWRIPLTVGQSSILLGLVIANFYHLMYLYDEVKNFVGKYITKKIALDSGAKEEKGV